MEFSKVFTVVTLSAVFTTAAAFGQSVISAKAGVIHYTEGEVAIGSGAEAKQVEMRTGGKFTELKDGQELSTREGRVEVLLNPGVFLRVGENSTVKMVSGKLSNVQVELSRGVALLEVTELAKDNAVSMLVNQRTLNFTKMALVRMEFENGIKVYKGETQVEAGGATQVLREGREMQFAEGNTVAKFDAKVGDPLYRWANRRAEYISMANIASANQARKSYGTSGSMYPTMGGWFYNAFYGMMTYLQAHAKRVSRASTGRDESRSEVTLEAAIEKAAASLKGAVAVSWTAEIEEAEAQ